MGAYSTNKLIDVGYKLASGILSTAHEQNGVGLAWYAEEYGLSPNQLSSDIWLQSVPAAADLSAANSNATNNTHIVKITTGLLKLAPNTDNTLWLATDGNGDRMRNFLMVKHLLVIL